MLVLVTYDIKTDTKAGQKRLRHVAKACEDYGQRVQFSVFECKVTPEQWTNLRHRLAQIINLQDDSLRFYLLGANWHHRIEHLGAKPSFDPDGPLIV